MKEFWSSDSLKKVFENFENNFERKRKPVNLALLMKLDSERVEQLIAELKNRPDIFVFYARASSFRFRVIEEGV